MFRVKFNAMMLACFILPMAIISKAEAAPQAPDLIGPSGMVPGAVNFQWFEVTGATWYRISAWNADSNNVLRKWVKAADTCTSGTCDHSEFGLPLSSVTSWRMKAFDGTDESVWSETHKIWDSLTAPTAPVLTGPINFYTPGLEVDFSWESLDDATWYKVQAEELGFPANVTTVDSWLKVGRDVICTSSSCEFMSSFVPNFGLFLWRVRAYNGAMLSPWAEWEDVTVGD